MTSPATYSSRPAEGAADLALMYDLVASSPDQVLHVVDLPWRLSSPSARDPERTRIWESSDGEAIAWAVLQFPWHCLDYQILPSNHAAALEVAILDWGIQLLNAEAAQREEQLPFLISAQSGDTQRIASIEQAGFTTANFGYVHLARDLDDMLPDPALPDGFTIRPLAGESEVEAYVAMHRAAFGSTNMTVDWRQATLRDPHYEPSLDLVAVGTDGALVGFCVCWITPPPPGGRVAQVEPLGILPDYQRSGLGRALLFEAFKRAKALGATRIEVNAETNNDASQQAYAAAGFRLHSEFLFFIRMFPPTLGTSSE